MDPLNLLVARQNAADQVRETANGGPARGRRRPAGRRGRARTGAEPADPRPTDACGDGRLGPVVHVAWWRRQAARFGDRRASVVGTID
jgi:hypothetical protein